MMMTRTEDKGLETLICAAALLMALVVVGCTDDSRDGSSGGDGVDNNTSANNGGEAGDCGAGELLVVDGDSYCVFQRDLVIENGFDCPMGFDVLTPFGPIGVCSMGELEPGELVGVAEEHRGNNPDEWEETECVQDNECDPNLFCTDARCEQEDVEPVCAAGEMAVRSESECLQDDATCYEVGGGWFCTGPDGGMTPSTCQPDEMPIESEQDCLQDVSCYELPDGTWCTGGANTCPEGFESPPEPCETESQDCFMFAEGVWCARVTEPLPTTCEEYEVAYEAELENVQRCEQDEECGQVIEGSSCGCTRNLVARTDADLSYYEALTSNEATRECGAQGSTCDCPEADGFACVENRCTWNYTQN